MTLLDDALLQPPEAPQPTAAAVVRASRVTAGWRLLIAGRWFEVIGDPCPAAQDEGRIAIWYRGPGAEVLDVLYADPAEPMWARPPVGDLVDLLLSETAGPGVDGDQDAPGGAR